MNEIQRIDDKGYELILQWEGKRNQAYLDSVRIPTIGIGFIKYTVGARSGYKVKIGDTMTDDEIKVEFMNQIKVYEDGVQAAVKVPLTQAQFNACVSLCYNIGVKAFTGSTVVRRLNERKYKAACDAFGLWDKAGGRVIQGLANRRKAEQKEFFRMG